MSRRSPSAECAEYLEGRPGFFAPKDVGAAIGISSHQAAVSLRYLWELGRIDRLTIHREGYARPLGRYGTSDGVVRPATLRPAWADAERGTAQTSTIVHPPSKEK